MKKFLTSLFAVLLVVGIAATALSYKEAIIALKGNTVNLNESVQSDYDETAMIEGEIYKVYDCIATEEVTTTNYGVKSTEETNFYLIESFNKEWFDTADTDDDYESLTLIYATSNEDQMEKLDSMVDDWSDFLTEYYDWYYDDDATDDDMPEFPSQTIEISGIIDEFDDDDLNEYRDEYIEDMGYADSELEDFIDTYCVDYIIKDANVDVSKTIFIIGIALAVIGLIGLILTAVFVKSPKKDNADMDTAA